MSKYKPYEVSEEILDEAEVSGDFEGTLRDYFKELLCTLWREGESFSGKRPFGNSGWQCDVYVALIEVGTLPRSEAYENEPVDTQLADKYIRELICCM